MENKKSVGDIIEASIFRCLYISLPTFFIWLHLSNPGSVGIVLVVFEICATIFMMLFGEFFIWSLRDDRMKQKEIDRLDEQRINMQSFYIQSKLLSDEVNGKNNGFSDWYEKHSPDATR